MSKTKTWKYVPGCISVELDIDDTGKVFDLSSERGYESEEFALLKPYIGPEGSEVVVNFLSSGFYEPMSRYGGPDTLGNPEYLFDERTLDNVSVDGKEIPKELAQKIFDLYFSQVEEAELSFEGEYDDRGD